MNGHTLIRILEVLCTAIAALEALLRALRAIVAALDNLYDDTHGCDGPDTVAPYPTRK